MMLATRNPSKNMKRNPPAKVKSVSVMNAYTVSDTTIVDVRIAAMVTTFGS